MSVKYTKEVLKSASAVSTSISGVLRILGLKEAGGNHSHIKKRILAHGIDISHFIPYVNNLTPAIKKPWQKILILRNDTRRDNAYKLRRALVESGTEYKCNKCGVRDLWQDSKLVLEVNHINGNWSDNRKENLEFLCPNCHSQVPVHRTKKKKINLCSVCGKQISKRGEKCKSCSKKLQANKINWPSTDGLLNMIAESSYLSVANKLGVSDNAVRKRIKNHAVVAELVYAQR